MLAVSEPGALATGYAGPRFVCRIDYPVATAPGSDTQVATARGSDTLAVNSRHDGRALTQKEEQTMDYSRAGQHSRGAACR